MAAKSNSANSLASLNTRVDLAAFDSNAILSQLARLGATLPRPRRTWMEIELDKMNE